MKRSLFVRIVILFTAILLAGGYVGYRAWSAARTAETEKASQPHFSGTKSAEILPVESVESAKAPAPAPEAEPAPEVFHGSKSAPIFESPKTKKQIATPRG